MTTFLAISSLLLGTLCLYLIKLVFKEREYQLEILEDLQNEQEKIEAIEMANESFRKEFGELKERYILEQTKSQEFNRLVLIQNEYFRGVLYDKQNDTIVLAENLERLGEL